MKAGVLMTGVAYVVPLPKLDGYDVNVSGRLWYYNLETGERGEYNPITKEYFKYTDEFKPKFIEAS